MNVNDKVALLQVAVTLRSIARGFGWAQVGDYLHAFILALPALAEGKAAAEPFVMAAIHLVNTGGPPDDQRWAELLAGLQHNSATLQEIAARDASNNPKQE